MRQIEVFEAREVSQIRHPHRSRWAVALLGDDDFRFALQDAFGAVSQRHQNIRIASDDFTDRKCCNRYEWNVDDYL